MSESTGVNWDKIGAFAEKFRLAVNEAATEFATECMTNDVDIYDHVTICVQTFTHHNIGILKAFGATDEAAKSFLDAAITSNLNSRNKSHD